MSTKIANIPRKPLGRVVKSGQLITSAVRSVPPQKT